MQICNRAPRFTPSIFGILSTTLSANTGVFYLVFFIVYLDTGVAMEQMFYPPLMQPGNVFSKQLQACSAPPFPGLLPIYNDLTKYLPKPSGEPGFDTPSTAALQNLREANEHRQSIEESAKERATIFSAENWFDNTKQKSDTRQISKRQSNRYSERSLDHESYLNELNGLSEKERKDNKAYLKKFRDDPDAFNQPGVAHDYELYHEARLSSESSDSTSVTGLLSYGGSETSSSTHSAPETTVTTAEGGLPASIMEQVSEVEFDNEHFHTLASHHRGELITTQLSGKFAGTLDDFMNREFKIIVNPEEMVEKQKSYLAMAKKEQGYSWVPEEDIEHDIKLSLITRDDLDADKKEFTFKHQRFWDTEQASMDISIDSSALSTAMASTEGWRDEMEDRQLATTFNIQLEARNQSVPVGITAIFDGHGGREWADYLADHFTGALKKELEAFCSEGITDLAVYNAITQAFVKFHWSKNDKRPTKSGSTANVAVLIDDQLWIGNAGDSSAYLTSQEGSAERISVRAYPGSIPYEAAVKKRGGMITYFGIHARVAIPNSRKTLGTASSFGDDDYMGVVIVPPDVIKINKEQWQGKKLVQTCDGIDMVAPQALGRITASSQSDLEAAARLVKTATLLKSTDNMSVSVTDLDRFFNDKTN